jgi:hypothetical protein
MKRLRPPREVKFGHNPDIRLLNYRFVNDRNGASGHNDSRGLAGACAKGFSEHPQRPRMAPASLPPEVYLQCRNRCHGPIGSGITATGHWFWSLIAPLYFSSHPRIVATIAAITGALGNAAPAEPAASSHFWRTARWTEVPERPPLYAERRRLFWRIAQPA